MQSPRGSAPQGAKLSPSRFRAIVSVSARAALGMPWRLARHESAGPSSACEANVCHTSIAQRWAACAHV